MKNTCTITIKDEGDGKIKVDLTFKRALMAKDNLTPAEILAFDTLKFIKDQQV